MVPNPDFEHGVLHVDAGIAPSDRHRVNTSEASVWAGDAQPADLTSMADGLPTPPADGAAPSDGPPPGDTAGPAADGPPAINYNGDLARGLIVYLPLDDGPGTVSLRDGSGRGAVANLRNITATSAWMDGRFVRALALVGPSWSGWVEVGSNANINALNAQVSFAMWVWREETGGTLLSRRAVGPRGFVYELGLSGEALFARLNSAAAYNVRVMGPPVPAGRWVHVAMTYDTQNVRLFVDGKQVGMAAYQQQLPLETSAVVIGGAEQQDRSIGARFPGRIDDVAIYARVLSAADIAALAAGVQPPSR